MKISTKIMVNFKAKRSVYIKYTLNITHSTAKTNMRCILLGEFNISVIFQLRQWHIERSFKIDHYNFKAKCSVHIL